MSALEAIKALLGCQWGDVVHTPDMPERCVDKADRIVQLYGTPLGTIQVKLCAKHAERIELETVPHESG